MSDHIRLSTGREFYANLTILGLPWNPDRADELTYGYDGYVGEDAPDPPDGWRVTPEFTPEERREIAEHMIARWLEWAASPLGGEGGD